MMYMHCIVGGYFDKHMSMEEYVKFKCRAVYAHLYDIEKIIYRSTEYRETDTCSGPQPY